MNIPSFAPRCPNHGCPLDGVGFPLPSSGQGICPVSGWPFDFKADTQKASEKKDKFGNVVAATEWDITGND